MTEFGLIIYVLVVFTLVMAFKAWGSAFFSFSKDGRRMLAIAQAMKKRWHLRRVFTFNVYEHRGGRISLKGNISGSPVFIEISNCPENPFTLDFRRPGPINIHVARGYHELLKKFSARAMTDEEIFETVEETLRK